MEENIGYIYKITNKINGKVYIGQTRKSIKQRWNEHKKTAFTKSGRTSDYPLYRAFRKYGIENFKIEEIEECYFEKLNEREIYWIKYYNSTSKKGYNQSLGGQGNRTLDLDEAEVIKKYKEYQTIEKVAQYYKCSKSSISNILNKHNIKIISADEHAKERSFTVYMLDDEHKVIKTFSSLREAGRWVFDKGLTKRKRELAHTCINQALYTGYKTYGYYWYCLEYSDRDKEEYIEKKKEISRIKYKKNKEDIAKYKENKKHPRIKIKCPICGNLMTKGSEKCQSCYDKERAEHVPSKEELKDLLIKYKGNLTQIAKLFNISNNAVKKWCKKYEIDVNYYREIKEIDKDELINLLKETKGNITKCTEEYGISKDRFYTFCKNNNINYNSYKTPMPTKEQVEEALINAKGIIKEAAKLLEKPNTTTRDYIKRYNIDYKKYQNT